MTARAPAVLLPVAFLMLSTSAAAHETLHEVVRGKAIAVRAFFGDGEALAYTEYEVYSPKDPKIPHQKGRTDRAGHLSFVPDTGGRWRVRVIEKGGHGLDVEIDAAAAATPVSGPGAASRLDLWLRPVIGLAVIAAFFGLLYWRSRKGKEPL
jgi:nickel transport protein